MGHSGKEGFVDIPLSSEFGPFLSRKQRKFSSELLFAENPLHRYGPSSFPSDLFPPEKLPPENPQICAKSAFV